MRYLGKQQTQNSGGGACRLSFPHLPATILALVTVPSCIITLFSAFGVHVVPLIVVDTFPEVVTNSVMAFGSRFGVIVRVLKILENFVTIFPIASFVPVVTVTVTTVRMPLRSKTFTPFPELAKFAGITGLFSLALPLVICCVKSIDTLGVVGALCSIAGWRFG
jgi:hypothetical protein